jgi:hypothetical protein
MRGTCIALMATVFLSLSAAGCGNWRVELYVENASSVDYVFRWPFGPEDPSAFASQLVHAGAKGIAATWTDDHASTVEVLDLQCNSVGAATPSMDIVQTIPGAPGLTLRYQAGHSYQGPRSDLIAPTGLCGGTVRL